MLYLYLIREDSIFVSKTPSNCENLTVLSNPVKGVFILQDNMSYGYIYKVTNTIGNKIYIGQHIGNFDKYYLGSGIYINNAIKKYGRSNFKVELIIEANNKFELDNLEKQYIKEYRNIFGRDKLYNISDGGYGGLGVKWSDKSKHLLSLSTKGKKKPLGFSEKLRKANLGKKHSEETKLKISLFQKGKKRKPLSEETKRKIGLKSLGRKHTKEARLKMSNSAKGRTFSKETRLKISLAHKGKKLSQETKDKISKFYIGKKKSREHIMKIGQIKLQKGIIKNLGKYSQSSYKEV